MSGWNTLKYYEEESIDFYDDLATGYKLINENDLPKEFDRLFIQSWVEFPFRLITGIKINELQIESLINYSKENFEILNNLEDENTSIHIHRDGKNFESWFTDQKRMKTIRNIIE
ncbi:hypothetical protein ACEN2I_16755 [Flavobacterium sp. W22_SRS_FK3]|uniref:hypothetical protein n=1 Tax=Flavobacterium sp. W22_SRS_FK3 TaxID=3240275 RepID=UPI003F938028